MQCDYYIKKLKRKCKIQPFSNYKYCYRHTHLEEPLKILEKPEECPICVETFQVEEQPLKCGHYIHRECVIKSGKRHCPICRFNIYLKPTEMKECKNYEMQYRLNTYPSFSYIRTALGEPVDQFISTLHPNIRHHLQDVGIDNIIGTNSTNIHPNTFARLLHTYVSQSFNMLR